ncbi:unnamed protein product, partial [Hapterophycus canaliculatus]
KSRVRRFKSPQVFGGRSPILFRKSFTSNDIDLMAVSEDDHYSIASPLPTRLKIVPAPGDTSSQSNRKAVRFRVPYSDGAFRSELSLVHEEGFQERWYSAKVFIPNDWQDEIGDGSDIVMQWHAIPGNWRATYPNLSLMVTEGQWHLRRSYGSPQTKPTRQSARIGKVSKGEWTQWVFHMKWSPGDDGQIDVWKNDEQVFEQSGSNVYGTIG